MTATLARAGWVQAPPDAADDPRWEFGVRHGGYADPHETLAAALETLARDGGELVVRERHYEIKKRGN